MIIASRSYAVYQSSIGEETKAFYADLERRGPLGSIAVNLFRAQKCSARAKLYRGGIRGHGSYKAMAYGRKNWAIGNLADLLIRYAGSPPSTPHDSTLRKFTFGWKIDPAHESSGQWNPWVFYVDIPKFPWDFHWIDCARMLATQNAADARAVVDDVRLIGGQVSFHSPNRLNGPDYPGDWDGEHKSTVRIIEFCDYVLTLGSHGSAGADRAAQRSSNNVQPPSN